MRIRVLATVGAALVLGWAGAPRGLALVACVLAATAVALLVSKRRSTHLAGYAVGATALTSAVAASDSRPAVVLSLTALLLLTPPLLRELQDAAELWPLKSGMLPSSCPPGLDAAAERELVRARRSERPLTVVSISVDGPPRGAGRFSKARSLARTARLLARELRETDLVGYAGGHRLVALLTDTGEPDLVAYRLSRSLAAELTRFQIGTAVFPGDNPTWTGLQEIARRRESPAMAAVPAEESSGALVAEEAVA
jgi:hypothetical protein